MFCISFPEWCDGPVTVGSQCATDWIGDEIAVKLEQIVNALF